MLTGAINIAFAATPARSVAAALCLAIFGLTGCHRTPPAENAKGVDTAQPAATAETQTEDAREGAEGVTLTAEQAEKLGVATEPAKPIQYTAETSGFGIVISHDTIATAVAELTTAQAGGRQSHAALERAHRLIGTPGAMSADAVEGAARQAETDAAALALAEQRLTAIIGTGPPGGVAKNAPTLRELASGKIKLLRATFPLGALQGPTPATLRAAHLDALSPGAAHPVQGWSLKVVWGAPADATLPGRSFFGLLHNSDAGEGERLLVWAPGAGPSQQGVLVPSDSLLISDGKYWCYLETKAYVYVRRQINPDRPVANGYFVTEGIAAGDKVVTAGAGLLLARETNPSSEAD
jgi:hypothetical protein